MNITPSIEQTKSWRKAQLWYKGGKKNECEISQRAQIHDITTYDCNKTHKRINTRTLEFCDKINPLKNSDGYDWTEDFDGYINIQPFGEFYFNMKMVCDDGGAQNRTLREVCSFIENQLKYLLHSHTTHIYFINVLDGDACNKSMKYFKYILDNPEFSEVKKYVFIGDMFEFNLMNIRLHTLGIVL